MKRVKNIAAACLVSVVLVTGAAATPAHAAPVTPQGSNVCVWFPWLWWCR